MMHCLHDSCHLNINPFDTEPMAKIAVKMSIMRVVKFMSSLGNDLRVDKNASNSYLEASQGTFH